MYTCDGCTKTLADDDEAVEGVFSKTVETVQAGQTVRATPVFYHPGCWDRHPMSVSEGRRGLLKDLIAPA